MNLSPSNLLTIALLSSALTLGAAKGSAQQASFHLPVEAHWNSAVLQPGDYRLAAPALALRESEFVIRGATQSLFAMPIVADAQKTSNRSYLLLQKINGVYFVTQYCSGPTGKTYVFGVPKQARRQSIAKSETTVVAVTSAALK